MAQALVIRNVVDLQRDADFHAERRSQVLFGEIIEILAESGKYLQVRQKDGYSGWVRRESVRIFDNGELTKINLLPPFRVATSVATVFGEGRTPAPPYFLSYGSFLAVVGTTEIDEEKYVEFAYKNDSRRWILAGDVIPDPFRDRATREPDEIAENIVMSAFQFLGVPYLWGGTSALGLDCSGITQLVYSMHGLAIPRDSKDQREFGKEIPRGEAEPADLLFFDGHVVISLGGDSIIHSSLGEGGVHVNSLDKNDPGYRADLDESYIITRRIL